MNRLKYILIGVFTVLSMMACEDEKEVYYGDFLYDMVTYSGEYDGYSVFTFQSYGDSPLITLYASNVSRPVMPVGQRLLLNYEVVQDMGNNTQVVQVNGLSKVNTDTVLVVKQDVIDTQKMEAVKLKSVWRTGNYLNVRMQLQYTEQPRLMCLATSGELDENSMVNCYQIQDLNGAETYYWLETYFSYYIEPVWSVANSNGIRYYANDLSYPDVKYYDFLKK